MKAFPQLGTAHSIVICRAVIIVLFLHISHCYFPTVVRISGWSQTGSDVEAGTELPLWRRDLATELHKFPQPVVLADLLKIHIF